MSPAGGENGDRASPPDADGESSHASDSARGNATATGQDVTEGRRPHRPRAPDTGGSEARQPTALRGIADQAHRWRDLDGCLNVRLRVDRWGDLPQDAARGGAGVTWPEYGEHLHAKVEALVERLQQQRSGATLRRRRDLPKAKGSERP